jgi:trk system potassium uptake protein TrkA
VEVAVPGKFVGKTISEIDVRSRFGISIIAIRKKETVVLDNGETDIKEETTISPSAMTELAEGDVLVVIGKQDDIGKLTRE